MVDILYFLLTQATQNIFILLQINFKFPPPFSHQTVQVPIQIVREYVENAVSDNCIAIFVGLIFKRNLQRFAVVDGKLGAIDKIHGGYFLLPV